MKFLVPNYSCLQNPWLGGYAPRSPFSLSSTEFGEPPPPQKKKIPGYATGTYIHWNTGTYTLPLWHHIQDEQKLALQIYNAD
jgi:hypothetical protein